jgi:hypothetical protein
MRRLERLADAPANQRCLPTTDNSNDPDPRVVPALRQLQPDIAVRPSDRCFPNRAARGMLNGQGYIASGDPEQWKIVGGKLYLNFNARAKELWEADQADAIKRGHANRPAVLTNNQNN